MEHKHIDTAPRDIEHTEAGLNFGPWIVVGSSFRLGERARWRHPVARYDITNDAIRTRPGAWWGEKGALDFQPEWWTEAT